MVKLMVYTTSPKGVNEMKEKVEANVLFSKNLLAFMHHYDFTQQRLADMLGVSSSAVGDWTRGEKFPRLGTVDKMTEVFHCTRSDLLEHETNEESMDNRARQTRLLAYVNRLNPDGLEKVLTYMEDLNPKFYEVSK